MSNEVKKTAMHPAWQCAHRKLTNIERWNDRDKGLPSGYFDAQIALAMIVGGYGGDVVVTARDADGNPTEYAFPDVWVEIDEDAGRRFGPHPRLLREVHGDERDAAPLAAVFRVSERMYASLNGRG